jgi:hypothetical protein
VRNETGERREKFAHRATENAEKRLPAETRKTQKKVVGGEAERREKIGFGYIFSISINVNNYQASIPQSTLASDIGHPASATFSLFTFY